MLKVLLAVGGVLFIGLGVFGVKYLENLTGGESQSVPMAVDAQANVLFDESATTQVSTQPTTEQSSAEQSTTEQQTVVATASGVVEDLNDQASSVLSDNVIVQDTDIEQTAPVITEADDTIIVADNNLNVEGTVVEISADGAEPIAPAQAAGDLIAMAEQAKSASRNEQVNLATTVLASGNQPVVSPASVVVPTEGALDKQADAQSVIVTTTGNLGIDGLIVIKDRVNMREGPSIDHPVVLTLEAGHELMEFKRDGKWVHVGAYGTSGKIGWVHERLVGPAQ